MGTVMLCCAITVAILLCATNSEQVTDSKAITTTTEDPRSKWKGVEYLSELNACCNGSNIIGATGCRDGPGMPMPCEHKIELEPDVNPNDKFEITSPHHIVVDGKTHGEGSFCHTFLMEDEETNQTRPAIIWCADIAKHNNYYALFALKGALVLVSAVFVLATLYVYYVLKELRQTQDIVTCVMLVCLASLLFLLGMTQTTAIVRIGSFCTGFLVYFFSVAYFTWLNVIMLNVWKTTILFRWSIKEQYWLLFNHLYGWSVPTILTIVLYFNSEQHFSPLSCWLIEKSAFILHIPMAIILTLNLVLFGWSAFGIFKKGGDVSPDRRTALKYKFLLYLRLITLSGSIWFLELLSFYFGTNEGFSFWLLIDLLNALHGLGVFLVLVVFRKNIRRELAGKTIFCIWKLPNSWAPVNQVDEIDDKDSKPLN